MKEQKKEVKISIRIEEKTKISLQALSDLDKRSLSDFIRIELEKIVIQRTQEKNNELTLIDGNKED
ncbi:MAG TPA: hypothetical protein PLP23_09250 [Panacibacter sp.]|nr:hypothetical protein [Panacibacter sp.]